MIKYVNKTPNPEIPGHPVVTAMHQKTSNLPPARMQFQFAIAANKARP